MDLKDSAQVIVRLKELKIPYQIKDEGRAISVSRARADEARLGLAEKNLPAGGTVGWEIFDQSKLGATDFDRRIQFIRAISGELSRTINRISVVEDARVQIVIPETQLFQATVAPVTGSVLLKLKPGETLTQGQVNGIVYLVASSVENLKPANITIIDTNGNILTGAENAVKAAPAISSYAPAANEETVVLKPEEKNVLDVQSKMELEDKMTSKVQSLLNKLFPPNTTIARVNVDSLRAKKITVIILVDKTFRMTKDLKASTFDTVSAAVGYDKSRGDKIIMKSVTFRSAGTSASYSKQPAQTDLFTLENAKKLYRKMGSRSAYAIVGVVVIFLFLLISIARGGKKPQPSLPQTEIPAPVEEAEAQESNEVPIVTEMIGLASQRPTQVAELIKRWVEEEGGAS
jgi:flagellar biosynthesis/type III secretory pathway M-ring protein FliF/YscJ